MEQKKDLTKLLISGCFKELMLEHPFEKITIKMITDRAGIIRPTFYYHFQDKYELLEWIFEEEVINKINILLEQGMVKETIKMLFSCLHADRAFYQKALEVTGQNGFEEVMTRQIEALFFKEIKTRPVKLREGKVLNAETLAKYYTIGLVTCIRIWFKEGNSGASVDDLVEAYQFLMSHTSYEIFEIKK